MTWREFPNPFAPDPARWVTSVIVDPVDSNHAFVSYGGSREGYTSANVYETKDGTTWTNASGNLPNAPVNFLAYDRANDTLYAATDFGVFFELSGRQEVDEARSQPAEHGNRGSEDAGPRAASSTWRPSVAARGGSRS